MTPRCRVCKLYAFRHLHSVFVEPRSTCISYRKALMAIHGCQYGHTFRLEHECERFEVDPSLWLLEAAEAIR